MQRLCLTNRKLVLITGFVCQSLLFLLLFYCFVRCLHRQRHLHFAAVAFGWLILSGRFRSHRLKPCDLSRFLCLVEFIRKHNSLCIYALFLQSLFLLQNSLHVMLISFFHCTVLGFFHTSYFFSYLAHLFVFVVVLVQKHLTLCHTKGVHLTKYCEAIMFLCYDILHAACFFL